MGYILAMMAVLFSVASLRLNAASVKAAAAHQRIDVLVPHIATIQTTANAAMPKTGGTFTGSVTTQDHHVNGTLFGAGGTLTVGDGTHFSGVGMTADGTITGHSAINADGSLSGASIHVSSTAEADGGLNVGGSTAVSSSRAFSGASMHVSNAVEADGGFLGPAIAGMPVASGAVIGSVSGSSVIATGGMVNLLNAINNALT
jgi:hypothetical protein